MKNSSLFPIFRALKYFMLPVLGAVYPAAVHYANNARLVLLSSFVELCIFLGGTGLIICVILILSNRGKLSQSALGALLLLVFFYTYGPVFDWLRAIDIFQIEIYNLMPVWVFAAFYFAWLVMGLDKKMAIGICNVLLLIVVALVVFNLIKIIPMEIEKNKSKTDAVASASSSRMTEQQYPDIYFLIFDEGAGFEVARQYWHYDEVDKFVNFLERKGFYVAEESHGGSTQTLREIATRLNYQEYPVGKGNFETYNQGIGNNAVMSFLKAHGYTIIAYDERRVPFPTGLPMPADFLFEESAGESLNQLTHLDDYKVLVLQSTILRSLLNQDERLVPHRRMILYTVENIASTKFRSPKFVYTHLMLPHGPFAFAEDGTIATSSRTEYLNWQRYFENYKFFLRVAQEMIENILLATDGNAVIILQSDHGARNLRGKGYSGFLENYPDHYQTWIVNALYLPNCKDAPLTQDMNPINTFPIVFNCYFDAKMPLK